MKEQGGPKTRTVSHGAGSTGSMLGPALLPGEHRAHVSGTDTTPPRPGAQLAWSAAGRMKRVQLGRGKDVIRQATWSRQRCNSAGDLNRRTSRSWYVRGAAIPKGTTTPPGRSGEGATCSRRRSSTSADVAAERQVADHVRLAESRGDDDVKVAPSPRGCAWAAHSVFACSRGRVLVEV